MKPLIIYVDDEPNNLEVFKLNLSDSWEVKTFVNPLEALSALTSLTPCILVTDQKMPGLNGIQYLELARKLHPQSIRILITGYSDEDLVIDSIRKAQVFDYIKKPFGEGEIEARIRRAYEVFKTEKEADDLREELTKKNIELQNLNQESIQLKAKIESYIHPALLSLIEDRSLEFPIHRDLVGITFDVIDSSRYHDELIDGEPLIQKVIQLFSQTVLNYGGCREALAGDSVFAHFGISDTNSDPVMSALATAEEFRVKLNNLASQHSISIRCGIAIHIAKQCKILIHQAAIKTARGVIVQNSICTSSSSIDLLHRLEKIAHDLPGTNIILSGDFLQACQSKPAHLVSLGQIQLKGQSLPVEVLIRPDDRVNDENIIELKSKYTQEHEINRCKSQN